MGSAKFLHCEIIFNRVIIKIQYIKICGKQLKFIGKCVALGVYIRKVKRSKSLRLRRLKGEGQIILNVSKGNIKKSTQRE